MGGIRRQDTLVQRCGLLQVSLLVQQTGAEKVAWMSIGFGGAMDLTLKAPANSIYWHPGHMHFAAGLASAESMARNVRSKWRWCQL